MKTTLVIASLLLFSMKIDDDYKTLYYAAFTQFKSGDYNKADTNFMASYNAKPTLKALFYGLYNRYEKYISSAQTSDEDWKGLAYGLDYNRGTLAPLTKQADSYAAEYNAMLKLSQARAALKVYNDYAWYLIPANKKTIDKSKDTDLQRYYAQISMNLQGLDYEHKKGLSEDDRFMMIEAVIYFHQPVDQYPMFDNGEITRPEKPMDDASKIENLARMLHIVILPKSSEQITQNNEYAGIAKGLPTPDLKLPVDSLDQ